jgi:hypothetical protein
VNLMREIGAIKQSQIQRSSLKQGQRPYRYYDPAPLLPVERLRLNSGGALGIAGDGEQLVDVHHADHPDSKNRAGVNALSIGFTSHYRAMRERFGSHLADGCAGENMLIETDALWTLEALGQELVIECRDGRAVVLEGVIVAAPCVEFSRFANLSADPLSSDQLRATLQFLDGGVRGFYLRLGAAQGDAEIRAGDRFFAR